jgi:hypothetical protein
MPYIEEDYIYHPMPTCEKLSFCDNKLGDYKPKIVIENFDVKMQDVY